MSSEPNLTLVEAEKGPQDPRVGEKLDNRYIIKKLLGQGGMGVVYFAIHEALEKPVAVKILKPDVSRDEKIIARFRREARAASAIGSPHICDVSDFGTLEDGSTYFVMEMLDGPSLSEALTGEPMETPRILKIGSQLAEALGAAHARQIVHRDLKPDNVHLVRHGNDKEFVKVLDFGIAKVASNTETQKLTQAGQVFGTPHYMSPEQCAGHEVDHRTDIYALGVMLYEMACGRVPFDADNLMGLLTKHVYEQPIPPRELPPPVDVPPGLESIILKCLAKKPSSRYQTMAELKADLDALASGSTPEAVVSELDRSLPQRPQGAYQADSVVPGEPPATGPTTTGAIPAEPAKSGMSPALIGALVAIPVFAAGAFGVTYFLMPGDDPADPGTVGAGPTSGEDPVEDPVEDDPEVDPDEDDGEGDMVAETTTTSAATVTLVTVPEGAEVTGPDGALVGNTPVDITKPAEGEDPVEYSIHLSGYTERTFTVSSSTVDRIRLTMDEERSGGRRGTRRGGSSTRRGSTGSTAAATPQTGGATPAGGGSTSATPSGTTSGRRGGTTSGRSGGSTGGATGPSLNDLRNPFPTDDDDE